MIGLIIKLIVCPITILISNYLFGLQYTVFQAIIVGLFLAVAAHIMEFILLRKGTFALSTFADLFAAFLIVYLSQFVLRNVTITLTSALFTALLLTATEYFQHKYLISTGKTKKSRD